MLSHLTAEFLLCLITDDNLIIAWETYRVQLLITFIPFKLRLMTSVKSVGFIIIVNMSLVIPALLTKMSTGPTYIDRPDKMKFELMDCSTSWSTKVELYRHIWKSELQTSSEIFSNMACISAELLTSALNGIPTAPLSPALNLISSQTFSINGVFKH